MQNNEEKIYGLIIQAQEMQKFALEFRCSAEDTLEKVPGEVRSAVKEAAEEILLKNVSEAEKAISDVSRGALAAAHELRSTLRSAQSGALIRHITILFLVTIVLCAGLYFGLKFLVNQRVAELHELNTRAQAMQATVNKLNSQYGKAVFSTCDGRPCVRVNERLGKYGDQGETFYILFNY